MDEAIIAETAETTRIVPRRPWLAALLSLLFGGPIGQIYAGRFRRSMVLWCATALLLPTFAFVMLSLPLGRLATILLMLLMLGVPFYLAVDAFLVARRHRNAPLKRYQRWWVYLVAFLVFFTTNQAVARIAKRFLAEAFNVPGRSMSPTILHQDRILVDRLWFDATQLQRNDVVVFRVYDPVPTLFVSRVVGLPDDEIEIKNERVFINGSEWDDRHAVFDGPLPEYIDMANHGPIIVPYDCCFVLGDNRRNARDSRFLGPIPLTDLYGQARFVYWSRDHTFPNPEDRSSAVLGRFRWDRIGQRLD